MGPKKGQKSEEDSSPTDTPTEFELGDTATDIQRRREERETRERDKAQKQMEETRRGKSTHSAEEGVAEKLAKTDKSDTEMDTEAGEETVTSQ